MMELYVPLGLLGLLGIVALIIIYIIKPNYLTKYISSTHVWKLSLKYRRRRHPTNKVRNILIFLCQVLSLVLITGILAMPVLVHKNETNKADVIAVIDSSASMYTQKEGETRFERAVNDVIELSRDVFARNGYMSVIIADNEPHYLMREVSSAGSYNYFETLNALLEDERACYYGISDIDAAMALCEDVLDDNPSAQIHLFTDTTYQYIPDGITVVPESKIGEWNAGILSAKTEVEDVYQVLTVEIASYGRALELAVNVEVSGANALDSSTAGSTITLTKPVYCNSDVVNTVVFKYFASSVPEDTNTTVYYPLGLNERFQTYQSIHVSLEVGGIALEDSFAADDGFDIYGGQKEVLRIQYASSRKPARYPGDLENPGPNLFVNGALGALKNAMRSRYDIIVTEIAPGREPALEGFDLYIFEHDMPETLPTDGVVFLLDPTVGWTGAGIDVMQVADLNRISVYLMENVDRSDHPVLRNPNAYKVVADNITVSKYKVITCDLEAYDVLMTCNSDPVLLVQKNEAAQVAVMSFSVHFSNLPRLNEMFYLFYNLFDYYFPGMVNKNAFEVGEAVTLNARGSEITVTGFADSFTEFPYTIPLDIPGTYSIRQRTYYGKTSSAEIFVKVPALESNIRRVEDSLSAPLRRNEGDSVFDDLLIYLATALGVLFFTEWWLHAHEGK